MAGSTGSASAERIRRIENSSSRAYSMRPASSYFKRGPTQSTLPNGGGRMDLRPRFKRWMSGRGAFGAMLCAARMDVIISTKLSFWRL